MDDVYEIMRQNLGDTYKKVLADIQDIEDDKKNVSEIINSILEFCNITYFTLDAMLQIQLGIIKNNDDQIRKGL